MMGKIDVSQFAILRLIFPYTRTTLPLSLPTSLPPSLSLRLSLSLSLYVWEWDACCHLATYFIDSALRSITLCFVRILRVVTTYVLEFLS